MHRLSLFLIGFLLSLPSFSEQGLRVMTTTHELRWLTQEIGGDKVVVESLLSGKEDPHHVDVLPSHIQKVSRADIVCSIGLDLEIGWLPRVLARSGNRNIQSGGRGFCQVGSRMTVLHDREGPIDRSMGDVHPAGNPHFWMSPREMIKAGEEILAVLHRNRPTEEEFFNQRFQKLKQLLTALDSEIKEKLSSIDKNAGISQYHTDFSYFLRDYGLRQGTTIEEIPGIPPSSSRLKRLSEVLREESISLLISSPHYPERHLRRLSKGEIPYLITPALMREEDSYPDFIRGFVGQLLEHLPKKR